MWYKFFLFLAMGKIYVWLVFRAFLNNRKSFCEVGRMESLLPVNRAHLS